MDGEAFQIKARTASLCGYSLVLALSWAALKMIMVTLPLVLFLASLEGGAWQMSTLYPLCFNLFFNVYLLKMRTLCVLKQI